MIIIGWLILIGFLSLVFVVPPKRKPVPRKKQEEKPSEHKEKTKKKEYGNIFGGGSSESFSEKITKDFDDYDPGEFWHE